MRPLDALGLAAWRQQVVAPASGRVLEIGIGTGLNLPYYGQDARLVAIEPDGEMLRRAMARAEETGQAVALVRASAEALPFVDGAFDAAVATLVFCSVADAAQGLGEARRVLRPGGCLRLLEHVRATPPLMAALQDRLTPTWQRLAAGCRLNRNTLEAARQANFEARLARTTFMGILQEIEARRP
jgi:ubiquinone/menaquinone biosynthesis C-methylase UbiE